jgi:hypothetical protein
VLVVLVVLVLVVLVVLVVLEFLSEFWFGQFWKCATKWWCWQQC